MEFRKHPQRRVRHYLSFPFIWMMIIPLLLLDIFLEVYHRICFPLYGLPRVQRSSFIRIDRHRLSYLSWYEKICCAYCGYANGLLYYASRIGGATERYWCGIRHRAGGGFVEPSHHRGFLEYGDEKGFQKFVGK